MTAYSSSAFRCCCNGNCTTLINNVARAGQPFWVCKQYTKISKKPEPPKQNTCLGLKNEEKLRANDTEVFYLAAWGISELLENFIFSHSHRMANQLSCLNLKWLTTCSITVTLQFHSLLLKKFRIKCWWKLNFSTWKCAEIYICNR